MLIVSAVGAALRGIGLLISLFGALIALFGFLLVASPEEAGFDAEVWLTNRATGPMPEWLHALGPHAYWVVGVILLTFGIIFAWLNPLRPGKSRPRSEDAE
jgi:hypothetical protein